MSEKSDFESDSYNDRNSGLNSDSSDSVKFQTNTETATGIQIEYDPTKISQNCDSSPRAS